MAIWVIDVRNPKAPGISRGLFSGSTGEQRFPPPGGQSFTTPDWSIEVHVRGPFDARFPQTYPRFLWITRNRHCSVITKISIDDSKTRKHLQTLVDPSIHRIRLVELSQIPAGNLKSPQSGRPCSHSCSFEQEVIYQKPKTRHRALPCEKRTWKPEINKTSVNTGDFSPFEKAREAGAVYGPATEAHFLGYIVESGSRTIHHFFQRSNKKPKNGQQLRPKRVGHVFRGWPQHLSTSADGFPQLPGWNRTQASPVRVRAGR